MNIQLAESELILNKDGSIYHLNLRPEDIAETVITVGDPTRVAMVSKYFDHLELKREKREFITHTGLIGKKRISVISTGIGTDNIDIVLNELDALVNIDLDTRELKDELKKLNIIRLGTSGSLQKDLPVDSFVVSTYGIGLDVLMNFYSNDLDEETEELLTNFILQLKLQSSKLTPYAAPASEELLHLFPEKTYKRGVTVTCSGFYGPQGRILRGRLAYPELIDQLTQFLYKEYRITNFEMETAGIYGLGKMLGHNCLSVNAIVANRISKSFSHDHDKLVDKMIENALELISTN